MRSRYVLWIIVILTLLAILIDSPKLPALNLLGKTYQLEFPLKLGLDLQGGTQLILSTEMDRIDSENRDTALESAREVIERRVNLFGVSEAQVISSKIGEQRRIVVELPGLQDASAAAELVGKTAQLDFREMVGTPSAEATQSAQALFDTFKPTGLTGADLNKAQVTFGAVQGGRSGPQVAIEFTAEGAEKFAEITKRNVGKPLAMFLDDVPISWPPPTVEQEIVGGSAVITGQFSAEEAKNLAVQLNAGALPVPIKILEQRHIGPTLGQESVNKSLIAGGIGLLVVVIFMVSYYGLLGLTASAALVIYTLLVLAIFKTGLFILPPITLTLAGIAGFILSIGMAVDANILIFERMKEEIRWGKGKMVALELGFKRAWTSIWASNVSSLITAIILYTLGTSIVRGFAVTLAIGVLVSMFTAYVVTRTFLRLIIR
ncbi:protein translocase subunit SecD [Candidatus Daviesbacteria bacterium]|nr:protein translocase subunit SecD [Candidatus Daviesbacteria bacterium]MBI4036142.1 protein translocase subunit SecD [Candidatus Daviesbacteria bacterium]